MLPHCGASSGCPPSGGRIVSSSSRPPLPEADSVVCQRQDAHAAVGGEPVFASREHERADAAGERPAEKRDVRDGEHQRARRGEIVALQPQIGLRKRAAGVLFRVAAPAAKDMRLPVHGHAAVYRVPHAHHAVTALHRQVGKRPHDVRAQRRPAVIAQVTGHAGQPDVQPHGGEHAPAGAHRVAPDVKVRHGEAPRAVRVDHLHKRAVGGAAGDEREHIVAGALLVVPPLKPSVRHGRPSWRGCR